MNNIQDLLTVELLSEILGEEVKEVITDLDRVYEEFGEDLNDNNFLIVFHSIGYRSYRVENLDTLTRLCKEWCMNKYKLSIRCRLTRSSNWLCTIKTNNKCIFTASGDRIDTELEAVLKAVHYVMENK